MFLLLQKVMMTDPKKHIIEKTIHSNTLYEIQLKICPLKY